MTHEFTWAHLHLTMTIKNCLVTNFTLESLACDNDLILITLRNSLKCVIGTQFSYSSLKKSIPTVATTKDRHTLDNSSVYSSYINEVKCWILNHL